MKYLKYLSLVLLLVVSTTVVAQDDSGECQLSYLFNAWARPANAATPNGAVYGELVHIGPMNDTLVSASTAVADAVELHEMIMGQGDVMQMRPVESGFVIPSNSFLELAPGGLHIMLIGLKQELVAGETLDLTLTFEEAGAVQLTVPIEDMSAMDSMDMDMSDESEATDAMSDMRMPMMDWGEGCSSVYFLDPWARPAVPGAPNSAAYGLLVNLTDTDQLLISASTDVSEVVELHEMIMGEGDVMQMRPVDPGIAVPAGGATLLQPGGLHIMLINLNGELPAGETIDLGLIFDDGEEIALTAPVREPEMDGMAMGDMEHGMDDNAGE